MLRQDRLNLNRTQRAARAFSCKAGATSRLLNHSIYDQNICRTNGPPANGPERRCKAADQLQHDDSRNARHLLFTVHWLRIRIPFKGSCSHLQEALARSAGTGSAASLQWSTLRAREPRAAALTGWLSYTNSF